MGGTVQIESVPVTGDGFGTLSAQALAYLEAFDLIARSFNEGGSTAGANGVGIIAAGNISDIGEF